MTLVVSKIVQLQNIENVWNFLKDFGHVSIIWSKIFFWVEFVHPYDRVFLEKVVFLVSISALMGSTSKSDSEISDRHNLGRFKDFFAHKILIQALSFFDRN